MTIGQIKRFNVAGPCQITEHYALPALPRLVGLNGLIGAKRYFVLFAPHQSGKTTSVKAAAEKLNEDGECHALYCSLEELTSITDKAQAMKVLLANLNSALEIAPSEPLKRNFGESFLAQFNACPDRGDFPVKAWLGTLCSRLDKELVVFFDEADSLADKVLAHFLSQLRNGYANRDLAPFPRSLALIATRNLQNYQAKIRPGTGSIGTVTPLNFISEALTIENFTKSQIKRLYDQHAEATGQIFTEGALQRAWHWSEGQPWLVNALARQAVETIDDYQVAITAGHIDRAAENLIKGGGDHIGFLLDRLYEPRVKRFI
ncbi:MAG: ATP-binding protein, partial [Deltaproteobacteria bacterium]|nr:ATP-binding protein [Deltaproteobacteria bacterium]